jgi:hypothetical protein
LSSIRTPGARLVHGKSTALRTPQFCLGTAPDAPLTPHTESIQLIYATLSSWRSAGAARAGPQRHRSHALCIGAESQVGGRSSSKAQGLRVRYRGRRKRPLRTFRASSAACCLRNTAALPHRSSSTGALPRCLCQVNTTVPTCAPAIKEASGKGAPAKTQGRPAQRSCTHV